MSPLPPQSVTTAAPAGPNSTGDQAGRALVFGAGGVLGFAWTVGALYALQSEWGVDAASADLTIGTSAGSMLAALIGCGVDVEVIRRHQEGVPAPGDPSINWDYQRDSGGALPPRPGLRPGSPGLLLAAVRHPAASTAAVALSGLLPSGRGSQQPTRDVIAAAATRGLNGATWPARPRTWIVGTDYDKGVRTVFGRDAIDAELADAVAASCAIPGWYAPVEIAGSRYIDGGTVSNTSVDLLLPLVIDGVIDEVYVLAPMASEEPDRPRSPVVRLERTMRRVVTRGVRSDIGRLRAAGARVVLLSPGPLDLAAFGANLMNPRRRRSVLETSILTSASALRQLRLTGDAEAFAPVESHRVGFGSGSAGHATRSGRESAGSRAALFSPVSRIQPTDVDPIALKASSAGSQGPVLDGVGR